ncbi:MAG: hypothetical protein ACYSUX_02445 [Planctomycetota bacterium]|jgi:hypothetical protein
MVRGNKIKGMVMLLLFLGVVTVNAAPTLNSDDRDIVEYTWSISSYVFPQTEQQTSHINVLSNPHLATISKEFHKLPVRFGELPVKATGVKSMPPSPGTLLMVVVGFLCVSLVKDRRFWLAVLAGLLWAGQAGFSLLPQLATNVNGRGQSVKQVSSCSVECLFKPENPFRLRSHIEGTSYIDLLRHLAGIPGASTSSIHRLKVRHKLQRGSGRMPLCLCRRLSCSGKSFKSYCTQKEEPSPAKPFHFAITTIPYCIIQAANCFVSQIEQHSYLLKAFIIVNLARGPPKYE